MMPLDTEALVLAQRHLPLGTADLPGTGGGVGGAPEDFEVEEIPAYEPSGAGEHLYLWVEKRGVDSRSLFRHVARALEMDDRDLGYAGLKDTVAVTRQYLSVPARCEPLVGRIDNERIRVLAVKRHENKLRAGHLEGNRFRIVLGGTEPGATERARAIVARLAERGVPNYFGPQRFGREGDTLRRGIAILRGEGRRERRDFMLRLALSAVQSALFNIELAERLRAGTLWRVEPGEVLQVVDSGGPFVVADVEREQARFDAREVVPSGPMFGPKMRMGSGAPAAREQALLARAGLSLDDFARFGKLMRGTRRAFLVWPGAMSLAEVDAGLELRLTLPAGSYASVVVREVTKASGAAGPREEPA